MDLASLLTTLGRLEDLPRLVAALGHEARWEEAPDAPWLRPPLSGGCKPRAALVGRRGDFPWYGIAADEARRTTHAFARRLATWGQVGGVLGIAPRARRLAAAIAFGDCPLLELSLEAPDRLSLACLERLGGITTEGPLAYASRAAEVLGGQAVGRRFFRQFRVTLERLTDAMPAACGADDRRSLALLQLTRVLFLYLVQSKGWLDGRGDFLARSVDACLMRKRGIQRDLLRPLFFGTLNRPAAERGRVPREFGQIPFLNGGLFEPHPLERRWPADLPNPIWRDAFDLLFERFHFTADETGRAGAIAPDMLGRVFEGLMESATRRRNGTFYTPATLVQGLVQGGLTALISEQLGCSESRAERHLSERSAAARRTLRCVTLLDPAVGSGAFLLGALELLTTLHADQRSSTSMRRRILRHNLFGVDLDPTAVRLTELRLWLAVIADDPATHAARVRPLPNLDCLIRQGDSLLDPIGAWTGARPPPREVSLALARLRQELVTAVGPDKRALARELRRVETRAFGECLDAAEAQLGARIKSCLDQAREHNLFGDRHGLEAHNRADILRLRTELRELRQIRRRFRRDSALPWFHYQSHFADVFAHGGFDLVVGNPPWVRAEQLAPAYRARLAGRYRWWRSGVRRGFANRPDLSLAFLERGWELLRPGGACALLLPAKLATATYATHARHALAGQATLRAVADLTGRPEAAFDATVYPLALVATKSPPPAGHRVRSTIAVCEPGSMAQRDLGGGAPWVLARDPLLHALRELAPHEPRLGDRLACHLGVKTGANDLFLNPPGDIEPAVLRWAVRGRDVRPFRAERSVQLLWPYDGKGRLLATLPPRAADHLAPHTERLRTRADYVGGVPWTLFRTGPASAPYRVIWGDLARRLTAVPLVGGEAASSIPLNTCYLAALPDSETALRLSAWLNTTWMRAAARMVATPAAGGFARFNAQVVAGLPLPDWVLRDDELGQLAENGAAGCDVQEDLDDLTAARLNLSPSGKTALTDVVGVLAHDRR